MQRIEQAWKRLVDRAIWRPLEKLDRSPRGCAILCTVVALSIILLFVWIFGLKLGLYIAGYLGLSLTWYPALRRDRASPNQSRDAWRATQRFSNYFKTTPWWVYVGGIVGGILLFLFLVYVS